MKIKSSEIPQADKIEDVVKVVKAVYEGNTSFQDIAKYIHKVPRQGRYYRLAAEIIGLIKNRNNNAVLTKHGRKFISLSPESQHDMLQNAVLNSHLFQRLIPFFEAFSKGATKHQIENFIKEITQPVGRTMMTRRVSSVISWLKTLSLIKEINGSFMLVANINEMIKVLKFNDISEPLLPKNYNLEEYITIGERATQAKGFITSMISLVVRERANNIHSNLVNLLAKKIRKAGGLPRSNQLIDLASRIDSKSYIFEMKSLNINNARNQIRKGISQLYEYRYLQNIQDAKLVLVIEIPLHDNIIWMHDYIEKDRNIFLVWDGNNELFASSETQNKLFFLW